MEHVFYAIRVGMNALGDMVMFCDDCQETFAKGCQGKTLKELVDLAREHRCDERALAFLASLRQTPKSNGDSNTTVA